MLRDRRGGAPLRRIRVEAYRAGGPGGGSVWGAVAVWLALALLAGMALNVAAMITRHPQPRPLGASTPGRAGPAPSPASAFAPAVPGRTEASPPPAKETAGSPSPPDARPVLRALPAALPARAIARSERDVAPSPATLAADADRAARVPDPAANPETSSGIEPPPHSSSGDAPPGPLSSASPSPSGPGTDGAPAISSNAGADRALRRYHVQAGAFARSEDAAAQSERLRRLGYATRVAGNGPFLVWVGGYLDEATAEQLLGHVRSQGFTATLTPDGVSLP